MKHRHPYINLPDRQFWKKEPAIAEPSLFDPISEPAFTFSSNDPVVTAGSCFAQHVARYIKEAGFNYLVTERAHPLFPEELVNKHNYATFTARYGNVYTTEQLKQLLERAYGLFTPVEDVWFSKDGRCVDPFRPNIQPGGFLNAEELRSDRKIHLSAVRRAMEKMSVFVFTLGLTECWQDTRDNAVFPIAPGVTGGEYHPDIIKFRNFNHQETLDSLMSSISFIRSINPEVNIILTVSPVPLNATYENKHVWVSTTASKAVLRSAAEEAIRHFKNCTYFPSFEIITSPYARGEYFAQNCRDVTEAGVQAVMKCFMKHYANQTVDNSCNCSNDEKLIAHVNLHVKDMERKIDVLCDEEKINNA